MTNEMILEMFKDKDELEKYELLVNFSSINIPIDELNVEVNEIKDCSSKLYQHKLYLYAASKILNGVCYLIVLLILNNIEPTFHKQIGLAQVNGLDVAIKRMMNE